jgi:hypothetical protein
MVTVYDIVPASEIPFYSLEREPVKFHGERCVEPEFFG